MSDDMFRRVIQAQLKEEEEHPMDNEEFITAWRKLKADVDRLNPTTLRDNRVKINLFKENRRFGTMHQYFYHITTTKQIDDAYIDEMIYIKTVDMNSLSREEVMKRVDELNSRYFHSK